MYELDIKPEADKIFRKLSRTNKPRLKKINKKILEIQKESNRTHKFLKKPLQNLNRAHIDTNFVLIFRINHKKRVIVIYYFDHHDNVYNWKLKT